MKTNIYYNIFIFWLVLSAQTIIGQTQDSTRREILFPFTGGTQTPIGDLSSQYGNFLDATLGIDYKTTKRFTFGFGFDYLFEAPLNDVSMFEDLANDYNQFIGIDGTPVYPRVKGRGFKLEMKFGKIFPITRQNQNSGIWLSYALGYLQHKVRIGGDLGLFPMLQDPYVKGYDRLSGGINHSIFIGYLYLPPLLQRNISDIPTYSNIFGLYAGIEINNAQTKSLRSFDFASQVTPTKTNIDQLIGLKVGWIFTLNNKKADGDIYY